MATYDSLIDRANDAGALIPEEYEQQIFQHLPESSSIMRLGRRLRDMSRNEKEMRVVDGLATAYFVTAGTAAASDSGRLQTSEVSWANTILRATKLGVIVPIPKDVLADTDYDIWEEIRPHLDEAFGKAFDAAVLYGTNAPSDWPTAIVTYCAANSLAVSLAAKTDIYDAIMGASGALSLIEAKGYMATGHVAHTSVRAKLRDCRDANGNPIFVADPKEATRYTLDGEPVFFPRNGSIDSSNSLLVSGDWTQLVWALRKGIEYQVLTEASIHNAGGTLQYNLAQDDLIALKATMRLGWALPTPPNRIEASTQYPFSVLTA